MKVAARQADGFVTRPPKNVQAVLVYGPDLGLVAERVSALRRAVVGEHDDPFRVTELAADTLIEDPARLGDEVAALSLSGGRRVVVVRDAGDRHSKAFADLLNDVRSDTLVVVEAGDLGPGSGLRRRFEGAAAGAALPCYEDSGEALEGLVHTTLATYGLRANGKVIQEIATRLGSDRLMNRRELEKLAVYKGTGTITLEDVEAILVDATAASLDDVVFAVGAGDQAGLDGALQRCSREGIVPIVILRAVLRHLQRLHLASAAVADGASVQTAVDQLRPPVFFRRRADFVAQVQHWRPSLIARAFVIITMSELDCKTTGIPAEAVCERALMRVATAARAAGR
ncbi:MAG: DNA polymerase III subunit delta [Alphaproteobacteria bacterium]|nr:DNA polymerase III subunit delta [Alphaproteobacteria bacterium]